jgi:hypothetical protein
MRLQRVVLKRLLLPAASVAASGVIPAQDVESENFVQHNNVITPKNLLFGQPSEGSRRGPGARGLTRESPSEGNRSPSFYGIGGLKFRKILIAGSAALLG